MRIAVVGAGVMGRNHARTIQAVTGEVAGIVDADERAARDVGRQHNAPHATALGDLLRRDTDIDAVVIATPTATHDRLALQAFEAGLHVLVEKPIALDLAAAHRIQDAAEAAGRILAVGHIERHNPIVTFTKDALDAGRFGRPITLSARRVSRLPGRIRDVGCILDIAIHDIDVLNHLAGAAPERVFAIGGSFKAEAGFEDHANLLLAYPGGVQGAVEANWLTPRKVRRLSLTCEEAFVECDYMDQRVEVSRTTYGKLDLGDLSKVPIEMHNETINLAREEPLRRELVDFIAAIQDGRPPLADGGAGIAALAVAQAALRSLHSGAPEAPRLEVPA